MTNLCVCVCELGILAVTCNLHQCLEGFCFQQVLTRPPGFLPWVELSGCPSSNRPYAGSQAMSLGSSFDHDTHAKVERARFTAKQTTPRGCGSEVAPVTRPKFSNHICHFPQTHRCVSSVTAHQHACRCAHLRTLHERNAEPAFVGCWNGRSL